MMAMAPHVAAHVAHLLRGARGRGLRVVDRAAGALLPGAPGDRFVLEIPACGTVIRWHVVYAAADAGEPPDFIFDTGSEGFAPVRCLDGYDARDPAALTAVLRVLLPQYAAFQRRRVAAHGDARLRFEYDTVSALPGAQFLVSRGGEEVRFNLPLPVAPPLAALLEPAFAVGRPPAAPRASLLLVYAPAAGAPPVMRLLLPFRHPTWLDDRTLRLPAWTDGMTTLECHERALESFTAVLEARRRWLDRRRGTVRALHREFGAATAEYDTAEFTSFAFVHEVQHHAMVVRIVLPRAYPDEGPAVELRWAHGDRGGAPAQAVHRADAVPHSPRWGPDEVAARVAAYIRGTAAPAFRAACGGDGGGDAAGTVARR